MPESPTDTRSSTVDPAFCRQSWNALLKRPPDFLKKLSFQARLFYDERTDKIEDAPCQGM
jgi:hypothetical protein